MTVNNYTGTKKQNQGRGNDKSLNEIFVDKVIQKNHARHLDENGGLKYDYSKMEYKNNHSYVTVICDEHGEFEIIPSNHLKGGACPSCASTGRSNTGDFVDKANKVHNNYYSYSKTCYKNSRSKVIITCPKHGDFSQISRSHLRGSGCSDCAGNSTLTTDQFIDKSKKAHGDYYNYDKTEYISNINKVTITCQHHGDFKQLPDSHIRGKGCRLCGRINVGWTKTKFKRACDKNSKGLATLYVIKCFNNKESFYKVGITSKCIKTRFSGTKTMPYDYEVIHDIKAKPNLAWNIESKILKEKYNDRYEPRLGFGGDKECFSSIDDIDLYLKDLL
ncbi:hypothetical protein [Psychrobacter sp. AOP7-A1-24]|uniref:hypothetical protein n=1 Tax=Psychrobacter sp. AOP7-A1-24 TaxID=3457646 RepID=UPI00402B1DD3